MQGAYSNAAKEFQDALKELNDTEYTDQKRLLNNISLSYNKLSQNSLALQTVEQGLIVPFNEEDEKERREQVRLLATKMQIQKDENQCRLALETFQTRESLKTQTRSPCTALLETELQACVVNQPDSSELDRQNLLNAILFGIGQEVSEFNDYTELALNSLVNQAEIKHNECYVGLSFNVEEVQRAILKLVH